MAREKISWTSKDETHLYGVTRGLSGTAATSFASNSSLCNATLLVFATDVTLNPEPGRINVGSETIWHNGLTQVGTVYHCDVATRGADGTPMYAHGPGAPVYDPVYNINNPATGTSVATYGVRSDTAYAGGALDRNTLDIYALKQLNEKKDALEYGQMIYTGLDVWQNATYGHMKSVSFTCPATDVGIFTINLHRATGTDTLTDVCLGENVKESFWDVRFRLSTATGTHLQHSLTTSATNTAVATVMITSPPTTGTLNLYYGSSWAVDYCTTFSASGITSLTCATMSTDTASTYNINDRGIVNVNCGDIFTLEETDGATKAWMVSGLEYDQSAGKLTVTYGVVEETALEQMSRNSEAFDIGNDVRGSITEGASLTAPVLVPIANFTMSATSGDTPFTVVFTDTSTYNPTSWAWDFGDGTTSTVQNPSHTYIEYGVYTVVLTVTNSVGSDTETRSSCITALYVRPDGTFVCSWGSQGSNHGQYNWPRHIATDAEGNVYVTEPNNARVQKTSSVGEFIMYIGSYGTTDGKFQYPNAITIDSLGNIYVTDRYRHDVQKFNSSGTFVLKFGSSGSGDGQFNTPAGIAIDGSGNIYVSDSVNNNIQKFTSSGVYVSQVKDITGYKSLSSPMSIEFDPSGNLYILDAGNSGVVKLASDMSYVRTIGSYGTGDSQYIQPNDISIDPDGNVYVIDSYTNTVKVYSTDGSYITKFNGYSVDSCNSGDIIIICVDRLGYLYTGSAKLYKIYKFT